MAHFTSHISNWELRDGTNNTWDSINCLSGRVEVIEHMGCWMLEIRFDTGKVHVSSHNTRDEAMRKAEEQASWSCTFGHGE